MGHLLRGEKKHPNNIFGFKTYPRAFLHDVVLESNSSINQRHLSESCNRSFVNVRQSLYHLTWGTPIRTWSIEHQTSSEWSLSGDCDDPGSWRGHGAMVSDHQEPVQPDHRPLARTEAGPSESLGSVCRHQPLASHPAGLRPGIRKLQTLVKLNLAPRLKYNDLEHQKKWDQFEN